MTDPSKIPSSKEVLEQFGRYLDLSYTIDVLTPETRDKMEATIKAAIPVAELHEQAVRLLEKYPSDSFAQGEVGIWDIARDTILTQLEALK